MTIFAPLMALTVVLAQQPQEPALPAIDITITVTAEDARRTEDAVRTLARADDAFLAYLSSHMVTLAGAMVSTPDAPKVYAVGPLTEREQSLVPVLDYLYAHQRAGGSILVRYRRSWTQHDVVILQFTQASFLSMMAAMVKGPLLQVPAIQAERSLWVGRTLVDLNRQAGRVIAERHIYAALAAGFNDKRIGNRIVELVTAMAGSARTFNLVPPDRLQEFRERAEPGFIMPVAAGTIRLEYDGRTHTTGPDELIWSFLRLFSGDNSADWATRAAASRRANLGRAVLAHLETQTP
jgi:hypothetical protein